MRVRLHHPRLGLTVRLAAPTGKLVRGTSHRRQPLACIAVSCTRAISSCTLECHHGGAAHARHSTTCKRNSAALAVQAGSQAAARAAAGDAARPLAPQGIDRLAASSDHSHTAAYTAPGSGSTSTGAAEQVSGTHQRQGRPSHAGRGGLLPWRWRPCMSSTPWREVQMQTAPGNMLPVPCVVR